MEANLSSGSMIPGGSGGGGGGYGGLDLQGSMRIHNPQHNNHPFTLQHHLSQPIQQGSTMVHHPSVHENFPLSIGSMRESEQNQSISLADFAKGERSKSSASEEDEPSFTEDAPDGGHNDASRGKKMSQWHRVKWTDTMIRLLITAVSYIGEDAAMDYGGGVRRKYSNLQKKGKWKSVSKVMAERGHFVSPQQCEDKFNDLNKRYKRLNEILGRGTSCEVVERPSLLDKMDHVSEKGKEEVRKILSSKHLYYEEMCSYHNGNRLHLPPDPELQRSLRLALRSRDDQENSDSRRNLQLDDLEEDDQDAEMDDELEENHHNVLQLDPSGGAFGEGSAKRIKQCQGHERVGYGKSLDCNKGFASQPKNVLQTDMNQALPEGMKANLLQEQWMKHRSIQLEEQRLHIQAQMLELEKERFKWQRFCSKRDRELEMMRVENERMKLENEQMALELKRKDMCADIN